ncbi:hypothetical protein HNS38_05410 [Lentimicrobium sp. L6]|uniref:hypothetical protein n=1 Tax=Lentimicrobium sp. L6 TaxID=2735916 RepID=UPI00155548A7|nr:hypothetical protein [Lentimicrobium sp. L6]NPD84185.1 hypothetical protein [Lentimicrobium sp. L6]
MKNNLLSMLFIIISYGAFSQGAINQSPIGIQTEGIKSLSNVAVSMPFFEDFESCVEPEIPNYWYKIVASSDTYANVRSYNTQGVDNSKCVKLVNVNDLEANLLLITPALEGGEANKYLHFYSWSYGSELSVV